MPFVKFVQFVKFVVEKESLCKLNSICQVVNQKWKSISYSYIDGYDPNNLRYGGVAAAPDDSVDFSITIDADVYTTITIKGDCIVRYENSVQNYHKIKFVLRSDSGSKIGLF